MGRLLEGIMLRERVTHSENGSGIPARELTVRFLTQRRVDGEVRRELQVDVARGRPWRQNL
jgi:hypothetical protein